MSDSLAFPTSHARMGSSSGQPLTRLDGHLKVTGTATYAADNHPQNMAHAVIAVSSIARGRVTSLDVAAAMAHPGVIEVITPANCPPLALDPDQKHGLFGFRFDALQNDRVRYAKQPIAVVVAETLEAATEGARLLAPTYDVEPARMGFDDGEHYDPPAVGIGAPPSFAKGDLAAGHAAATRSVDTTYETPAQYHNAMEPHAMVAEWNGDHLTIDSPNQAIVMSRALFAGYFGIPPENVLLRSPFLGGGFGSKAIMNGPYILTILAARMLQRPVKMVLSRDQMFGPVGHRGATQQHLRLGMDAEGRLTALEHNAVSTTSSFDDFIEPAANASHNIYASPAISTRHGAVRIDTGTPGPMRAPGEASGSAALECAIDEAALACGLDPLEFRLLNYAETDPATGRPFSSKALRECYAEGAKAFGWAGRPLAPRQMQDDEGRLIGWGMGTAMFPCPMFPASARATLRSDGTALVETAGADMGQGAWTALAQIAADGLGLEVERVEFRSGISDLPDAGVAGGSGHTASAGTALHNAGTEAIAKLTEIATADPASPLFGAGNAGVEARNGRLYHRGDETRSESYAEIMARAGMASLEGNGTGTRDPKDAEELAMYSHGAVFAEVKVDPDLCQVLVTRLVGAFAAGHVINPRLARSQLYGGMIWGVSFALHEEAVHDRRSGRPLNADLAGYHIPVHADIPAMQALLVEEDDPYVNVLGVKGVGEIGVTGTVGAIANAIWHATGIRSHRFPIRIEDLIG
ncbi:MAG: xanthine dehydrogenase family protein molybdopterin-binding subunit [Alphaproteobacteria bacterium]|nr:xanthine dehydrogenase family protein molybdopterin-binding subunit [Alphaproteobacteria bacterium]MBU0802931.1 xanthine dehydrogenase family protein molybdopterin-binding subunit [Alphaproteobacteria bacterium]MBU0870958.1 xanthine dehydrogenase family protein molybdopterin-binding subunit [Alphaproteobacteria bacterium]MBU1403371.1 xanthine dehydrogenase family protein molybdopterin-binding subunit [Alphaproteobacteria bacterium]MBU1589707.1 xanthine dehydrogenase family protein molybdopte